MKKITVFGALVFSLISTCSFAIKNEDISEIVQESFCKEFVNDGAVQWENKGEFVKAHFAMSGQILDAYFCRNGKLMAVTRNILSNELPIRLFAELKKEYSTYWITDLFEIDAEEGTSYYI